MLPFKLVYSDRYALPIGRHVFPATKYRLIRERLSEAGEADDSDFIPPAAATEQDLVLVHSQFYVNKLLESGLTAREELQLEIPYSPELVDAFLLHTGGTILAAERALEDGIAFNLGGGFHHAFPDHGEGFCMIHDVAIAIRRLQRDGRIARAMTVDCDVHHGNGTAAIFANGASRAGASISIRGAGELKSVYTLSIHQLNNYPLWKPPSSLDVDLADGTGDSEYLARLEEAVDKALREFDPELICYIAGADPFQHDQLGGLNLTIPGLRARDEFVLRSARNRRIPLMVSYAGGYAQDLEDTVTIHANTVLAAKQVFATDARRAG